jgi:hypothetical protein
VEYRRNGDTPWSNGGATASTSRSLSGLNDNQSYDVRVTPSDGIDDGTSRTALNLFTTEKINTPPTQPGTLSASAVTTDSATVSWGASIDDEGDTITYQVDYRRNGDMPWSNGGSTNATSQPLSGLDDNQSYDVRVTPNDGFEDGTSRTTANLFATEIINTPPTQPGLLSATGVTFRSATVNWDASTDIDGNTITYQVDYRRNGEPLWVDGGTTVGTSKLLNTLDSSQSYDVQVTPNDGTEDGASRTALDLFTTEFDSVTIFKDGFEFN